MDLECTKITRYLPECFEFIDSALCESTAISTGEPVLPSDSTSDIKDTVTTVNSDHQGCVLVHCMAGISRSSTIVIAYLIVRRGWSFEKAYEHVRTARPTIRPNDGFMQQLKELKQ